MKIAIVANSTWYLYNFRRTLMHALERAGHQPVAISPVDDYVDGLRAEGFPHIPLSLAAAGTNPLRELGSVLHLRGILKRGGFHAAFTYTPKANIYTGLAVHGLSIAHVPNVSGLGRLFIEPSWLTVLVKCLYVLAFRPARIVLFQNQDDRQAFIQLGLVSSDRTGRVPGSGVDLERFSPAPTEGDARRDTTFLFIGRLLRDKGIGEFVECARAIQAERPDARFHVLGAVDALNPTAVKREVVEQWQQAGAMTYLGVTDDVRPAIAACDCVVLPSYREGVPRSLLEAAAMAKPCITTDAPGCRDAVDDGVTGFLCEPRSASALTRAIEKFLATSGSQRQQMGMAGRAKMEREFGEQIVLNRYLDLASAIDRQR